MKESNKRFKKFIKSFSFAFDGIKNTMKEEQNIKVMIVMGIIANILSFVLKTNIYEKIIVLLITGLVLSLEFINTAIEAVVDLHDGSNKSKYGKIAKNSASGGVLLISIFALIIGIIIFMPKIIALF